MFNVRYPNGVCVTYNTATYLEYSPVVWELYTKEGGKWIATIQPSAGCIVESVPACRVENPVEKLTSEQALKFVADNIRGIYHWNQSDLKRLKAALAKYNSMTGTWRK